MVGSRRTAGYCELHAPRRGTPLRITAALAVCLFSFGAPFAAGQPEQDGRQQPPSASAAVSNGAKNNKWHIDGSVRNRRGEPIRGANVRLETGAGTSSVKTLQTDASGEFQEDLEPDAQTTRLNVKLSATVKGYRVAQETVTLEPTSLERQVNLVLADTTEDPRQLPLEGLISSLTPKLRVPAAGAESLGPELDEYEIGERSLEQDDPQTAAQMLTNVVTQEPSCIECRTLLALALLISGSWSGAREQLDAAAKLNTLPATKFQRSEPFTALGVLDTWSGQTKKATASFLEALSIEPKNPLALQELGRAFVLQGAAKAADRYLEMAIRAGAAGDAHLLRAEALLDEGKPTEAQDEMKAFLGDRRARDVPEALRALWAEMQGRVLLESAGKARSVVEEPLPQLLRVTPELRGLQPAKSQDELSTLLEKIGERVEAFVQTFPNTSSVEEIRMERLRPDGKIAESLEQNYRYLLVAAPGKSGLGLDEYRTNAGGAHTLQATESGQFMITEGFASAPLLFHPAYQRGSRFRYLGRQPVDGRDTCVIAFAQRPETAQLLESFKVSDASRIVLVQGLTWVDPVSYEIVRLRTDLLTPAPEIRLERQTTDIQFGQVRFKDAKAGLWLPRQVAVTVAWNGKVFRNQHSYSDFRLFDVQTHQRETRLKSVPNTTEN